MKYCPYCGVKLYDDMAFCPKCGRQYTEVGKEETSTNLLERDSAYGEEIAAAVKKEHSTLTAEGNSEANEPANSAPLVNQAADMHKPILCPVCGQDTFDQEICPHCGWDMKEPFTPPAANTIESNGHATPPKKSLCTRILHILLWIFFMPIMFFIWSIFQITDEEQRQHKLFGYSYSLRTRVRCCLLITAAYIAGYYYLFTEILFK